MSQNNNSILSPAWKLLGEISGTQIDNPYGGENARAEIDDLFVVEPSRILDVGCSSGDVGRRLKKSIQGYMFGVLKLAMLPIAPKKF